MTQLTTIFKKGNSVLRALLFVFIPFTSSGFIAVRDTIIIDGEVIYIEKEEVRTNLDSLNEAAGKDRRRSPGELNMHFHLGCHGLIGGTWSSVTGESPNFQTLERFTGKSDFFLLNAGGGLDLGYSLFNRQKGKTVLDIQLWSGVSFSQLRLGSRTFDRSLFLQDSLTGLIRSGNDLILNYLDSTGTGAQGETLWEQRSLEIPVKNEVHVYRTMDIPLFLRFHLTPAGSALNYFADMGVVYRKITLESGSERFLVNGRAQLQMLHHDNLQAADHLMVPVLNVGVTMRVSSLMKSSGKSGLADKISIGGMASSQLLPAIFNDSDAYRYSFTSFGLRIFAVWDL